MSTLARTMPFLTLCDDADLVRLGVRPLAIVKSSGDLDGQILAISEGVESEPAKRRRWAPKLEDWEGELKKLVPKADVGRCFSLLVAGVRTASDAAALPAPLRGVFTRMKEEAEGPKCANSLALPPNSHFESMPNPDPKTRDALFVASPAGGGKTVWCAAWTQKYRRLFPDRKVFILSKNTVADDPAWLALKPEDRPEQLDVSTLLSDNIDIARDFDKEGCLLIFDDLIDAYDGKMAKAVARTVQDSLQIGRRHNISVIITSHQLTAGWATRAILHDVHSCVLFANHTPAHSLRYFLKKIGLDAEHIIPVLRRAGRAVQVSVRAPQWWLGDREAVLLD